MAGGKRTDGPVSRYVNRRFSSAITKAIVKHGIGITPNQVSVISFAIAAAALPAYVAGLAWLAGILLQLGSIVDGVDGELARARGISSPRGAFLDSMLDRLADIAAYVGAAYYVMRYEVSSHLTILRLWGVGGAVLAAALVLAASGDILVSYLHSKAPELLGKHPALVGRIPSFASRDVRLFILFIASLPGLVLEGLLAVTAVSYAYVLSKFVEVFQHAGSGVSTGRRQAP